MRWRAMRMDKVQRSNRKRDDSHNDENRTTIVCTTCVVISIERQLPSIP